jgi:hypothetical protein
MERNSQRLMMLVMRSRKPELRGWALLMKVMVKVAAARKMKATKRTEVKRSGGRNSTMTNMSLTSSSST